MFTLTSIGSYSFTVALIIYSFVLPFSAVTLIVILFVPSLTSISPSPSIFAFLSSVSALMLIFVVPAGSVVEYSVLFLLNSGSSSASDIDNAFKLLFEL